MIVSFIVSILMIVAGIVGPVMWTDYVLDRELCTSHFINTIPYNCNVDYFVVLLILVPILFCWGLLGIGIAMLYDTCRSNEL